MNKWWALWPAWLFCLFSLLFSSNLHAQPQLPSQLTLRELWSKHIGGGVGSEALKLKPSAAAGILYFVSHDGHVVALQADNAHILWQLKTRLTITTGVSYGDQQIYFGTDEDNLLALRASDGKFVWQENLPADILATPQTAPGIVVAKTLDDEIFAFTANAGHLLWNNKTAAPALVMRLSSAPLIAFKHVFAGFDDGSVASYQLSDGKLNWRQVIAKSHGNIIERMIDIDAAPIADQEAVFVASYHGAVVALKRTTGAVIWSQPASSLSGLAQNKQAVFLSSVDGQVWSYDKADGNVLWHQKQLAGHQLTRPVIFERMLCVADNKGYVYLLDQQDGEIIASLRVAHAAIVTEPVVVANKIIVYNVRGEAYALVLVAV